MIKIIITSILLLTINANANDDYRASGIISTGPNFSLSFGESKTTSSIGWSVAFWGGTERGGGSLNLGIERVIGKETLFMLKPKAAHTSLDYL